MSKNSTVEPAERPAYIAPMLLRRTDELPTGPEWHYEVKWDGWRMQAIKCGTTVRLLSRNGADCTRRFAPIAQAFAKLRLKTLHTDGELVACDESGRPCFQTLQAGAPLPKGWSFGYYAFDLLHDGKARQHEPLIERRARLEDLVHGAGLRFSPALKGSPDAVTALIAQQRLEGVVAKRADSKYCPGERNGSWLKLPIKVTGHFVIGGYRACPQGATVLLVGQYDSRGDFKFRGRVRSGLSKQRTNLARLPMEQRIAKCPFTNLPARGKDHFNETVTAEEMHSFTWVTPRLRVPVLYAELTRMGWLRLPEIAQFQHNNGVVQHPTTGPLGPVY